jgi:glycosyltransferase involved in cell wall biosynthesis
MRDMCRGYNIKDKLRVCIYSTYTPKEAVAFIRIVNPALVLCDDVEIRWGCRWTSGDLFIDCDLVHWADLIVVQRYLPAFISENILNKLLSSNKPIIYEVDDLLFDAPNYHPRRKFLETIAPKIMQFVTFASAVTVSTEELKKRMSMYHHKIYVLPNLVDRRVWRAPSLTKRDIGRIRIGYAGSMTHAQDLLFLEEILKRILTKYRERIEVRFFGYCPSRFADYQEVKSYTYKESYLEYAQALYSLYLDIAIAPLVDNAFNRCKSNIKFLEYSCVGAVGLYSNLPPYSQCVINGQTGVLLTDDPAQWQDALEFLVNSPGIRYRMAMAARSEVLDKFLLQNKKHIYLDVWRRVACGY